MATFCVRTSYSCPWHCRRTDKLNLFTFFHIQMFTLPSACRASNEWGIGHCVWIVRGNKRVVAVIYRFFFSFIIDRTCEVRMGDTFTASGGVVIVEYFRPQICECMFVIVIVIAAVDGRRRDARNTCRYTPIYTMCVCLCFFSPNSLFNCIRRVLSILLSFV